MAKLFNGVRFVSVNNCFVVRNCLLNTVESNEVVIKAKNKLSGPLFEFVFVKNFTYIDIHICIC